MLTNEYGWLVAPTTGAVNLFLEKAKAKVCQVMSKGKFNSKAEAIPIGIEKMGYLERDPVMKREVAALRDSNAASSLLILRSSLYS